VIYGQASRIHFELVCDDANLKKLVGRANGLLTAPQGRTDVIYGDVWFKVPKGTLAFANRPHPYRCDDREPPLGAHPSVQPQAVGYGGTACELFIRMHYEKSDCTLTTFRQETDGRYAQVGQSVRTERAEYELYQEALRLHACYSDGSTAPASSRPQAPAPSAIYEVLRLGRAIVDPIPPNVKFGHWRQVCTPEGLGWMNLSQPRRDAAFGITPYAGIGVYSDADFPHWADWSLIDDDKSGTSLCESATIKRWLDLDGNGQVTHAEAEKALHSDEVKARMAKAICRIPIEWSRQGIEERWG
jgi:hypothetical protein